MFRPIINLATSFHDHQYTFGSKYITLSSDTVNNNSIIPYNNSSTDFICTFTEPFYFLRNSYEIGLVGICYKQVKPVISRRAKYLGSKLFPNLKPSIINTITYTKTQNEVSKSVSDFSKVSESANLNLVLTFGFISVDFKRLYITLHYNDSDPKKYVIFPYKLASVLGFTRDWFLPGQHDSYEVLTQNEYDKLPMGSDLSIHTEKFQNDENLISIERIYEKTLYFIRNNARGDGDFRKFFSRINAIFQSSSIRFAFLFNLLDRKVDIAFEGKDNEYPAQIILWK